MPELYTNKSSDPKRNAQLNLAGRTHYVDDETLRYFHARILSSRVVDDGLLFAVVESASGDANHSSRIYRYVIFDLFGTVIERPDLKSSWKSSAPAEKAMWRALNAIDAIAHTRAAIEHDRAAHQSELARISAKVDAIASKKDAA